MLRIGIKSVYIPLHVLVPIYTFFGGGKFDAVERIYKYTEG